jgi:uncharacterized repeat protein (TIGR03803 family)
MNYKSLHWAALVSITLMAAVLGAQATQILNLPMMPGWSNLAPLAPLDRDTNLNLVIGLPLRDSEGLTNLLRQLYDPDSTNYHRFLSSEDFAKRFSPTENDYQAVVNFAQTHGLLVTGKHSNRTLVSVRGKVTDIEQAFHVNLKTFQHPNESRTFYAPDVQPSIDLAVPVLAVSGLDNFIIPHPCLHTISAGQTQPNLTGSGPGGAFLGKDFRAAYVPGVTLTGAGQTVGLLEFDSGFSQSDITAYETLAGLPYVPVSAVLLDGYNGAPGGGNDEVCLDIEMAISMGPSLNGVIVYEGSSTDDILNRMATDNLAKQIGASWTYPIDAASEQVFLQYAAQGQSFFNASGDSDAYTGSISTPADDPNITIVGGTTLTTTGAEGAWSSETVWNWGSGTGSSGGISTKYSIPSWQLGINMSANQGSTTMRNIPDVAMTADNVYVIYGSGKAGAFGGTSCATPLWAGFMALVNQLALTNGQPIAGFINPVVYNMGKGSNTLSYTSLFHDITTGNNESPKSPTRFSAGTGYDLCTGWGTPQGSNLITALALPEPLRITPSGGTIISGPMGGPFTPVTQTYTLLNNAASPLNWTLVNTSSWLNVSPTNGTLIHGAPATTVTVSPAASAASLPPGSYTTTLWFTNFNDSFVQSRSVLLAIVTPPVITGQPASQAVFEGAPASFTVQTATNALLFYQWWQDNGSYVTNLTDGGKISGAATSTLTVSNVAAANTGAYFVIISNAAGTITSAQAFLTIVPWRPVITTQPADQTVLPGASASFGIYAVGTHPFSYQWHQNGTNLIDGITVSGSASNQVTLKNVIPANAGTYTVVVSNSLGTALSAGARLNVTPVTAPGVGLFNLYSFGSGTAGQNPYCPLVQAGDGNFYGTTVLGGINTDGTVFRVTTNGSVITLFSFNYNNGALPYAGLVLGRDGYLYGTTSQGGTSGNGTVFRITTGGLLTTLANFNGVNGSYSVAGLVQGRDGNFYGTTLYGGTSGVGNIFRVTPAGVVNNLYSFNGSDGAYPSCALVQDADGNLVGTTENGGVGGYGTVFQLTPWGAFSTLASFNGINGESPVAGLVQDNQGVFYGTTYYGGTNGAGTVFKLTPDGTLTSLYHFSDGADGGYPFGGLSVASDDNLYGTTEQGGTYLDGTFFRISPEGTFATLATFDGYQAAQPEASPVQGTDGNFYGTTSGGGASALGAVYRVTIDGPLQITGQPQNTWTYLGGTASFNVATFGKQPVSYQWRRYGTNLTDGGAILGSNSRTLTITNASLANIGVYSVVAANSYNSVTSAPAVFQLAISPPFITLQPISQNLLAGSTAAFVVSAQGDMPLYYQWQKNGTNLVDSGTVSGSTNRILLISGVTTNDQSVYSVTVSDDIYYAVSDNAQLNVIPVVQPGFTLTTLTSLFPAPFNTGVNPVGLIQASNGYLYGTAENGGTYGYGTLFRVGTNGGYYNQIQFDLSNGAYPYAGVIQGTDGFLYGTTLMGGSGSSGLIYRSSVNGGIANLYSFTGGLDGSEPTAALVQAADGNFYGTTYYGGTNYDGVVFRITPAGKQTALYSFTGGSDGYSPRSSLAAGADGNLYGTTEYGGSLGYGTVFSITTNGVFNTLLQFNGLNGSYPFGGLVQGADGSFYGTTYSGGTNGGNGTLFKLTTNGVLTTLVHFNGANGSGPAANLVQGSDGNLYGTTQNNGIGGYGTLFRVTTNGVLTTLVWFNWANGANPQSPVVASTDGNLYGTTYYGGANGSGTIFRITPLVPPRILSQPSSVTIYAGLNATFNVVATGTAPLGYQWQKNGTNLVDGGNITGSASSSLLLSTVALADSGIYSVTVSNPYGAVTSTDAVLNVILASPVFIQQPTNLSVLPGMTASFNVTVAGSLPIYYQWQVNGTNLANGGRISGATASTLAVSGVYGADAGTYSVIVSNTVSSLTSSGAVLNVVSLNAPGVTLLPLGSFTGIGTQGANPNGLVLGPDRRLYGTTQGGGTNGYGTIFVVGPDGNRVDLYSFTGGVDGNSPFASLMPASDGYLYGTAQFGGTNGYGTIFRFATNGVLTPLYSFTAGNDGNLPAAAMVQGLDGSFYGTTFNGGTYGNGNIFKYVTNGAVTTLYSFTGFADGGYPQAALVQGANGTLYGASSSTIFSLSLATNGVFTTLHSFTGGSDGGSPSSLIQALDGYLYGTTAMGGVSNAGTFFRIATNGNFLSIYSFSNNLVGNSPSAGLLQYADNKLYGSTAYGGAYNAGTLFSTTTNGSLTTLVTFDGFDGANPQAPLVTGPDGALYGTTLNGGLNGNGTVFRLGVSLPSVPSVIQVKMQNDGTLTLTWTSLPGHRYQLEYISSLTSTDWIMLGSPMPAIGGILSTNDTIGADSQRFYRIVDTQSQ